MAIETVDNCPICKGTSFALYHQCTDFTTSKEVFAIVKCENCKLLITSPRPDSNSIGKYYQSDQYISHTNNSKQLIDKVYKTVRHFTLRWKVKTIQTYHQCGKLLDYGCGTGEFLQSCKQSGYECFGVEPSKIAREKAEQTTQLKVSETLEHLPKKKFDVITLWHVLEHVEDLNEKIETLKNLLTDDGTIFIAVPNHESYDANFYKEYWAGYDVPRHLWHFSQKNMRQFLNNHALSVEHIIPMRQDSYYVSLLSEKYINPESNILANSTKALLMGLKSNQNARTNQNYSSLIYIVRK